MTFLRRLPRRAPLAVLCRCLALSLLLTGCYTPGGNMFTATDTGWTYLSTTAQPINVSVVDVRTGKAVFSQDIPEGSQITMRIIAKGGTSDEFPARLQWTVVKAGTQFGRLRNAVSCPPEEACRIDVNLREPSVEAAAGQQQLTKAPPGLQAPNVWPDGGVGPEAQSTDIYDSP